ncbi:MAG: hypothetical protein SVW57_06205 [Thermodesulfobacteriota bacterium]|nr:hypothetical protein [Thermodesulfobacteriota bacterium]
MSAFADWETGSRIGFESNIDRSIDDGESDTHITGYVSLVRGTDNESRINLLWVANLEGTVFTNLSDLSYGLVGLAPYLIYVPLPTWTVSLSPFFRAKATADSDLSSLTFGAKVVLEKTISRKLYAGQYYIYTDSNANVETYSYNEHLFGAFIGFSWSKDLFSEMGYEFSRGDSFRTIDSATIVPHGRGRFRTFSEIFGMDIISEKFDQHAVWVSTGIDWNESLFSHITYTFNTGEGENGSAISHSGSVGIGYRF